VPADGCGRESQPRAECSSGRRAVLQDRPGHPRPRTGVRITGLAALRPVSRHVLHGFHNTIVLYFRPRLKATDKWRKSQAIPGSPTGAGARTAGALTWADARATLTDQRRRNNHRSLKGFA
jgi:hypothetical protein